jgi:hypothetical protein
MKTFVESFKVPGGTVIVVDVEGFVRHQLTAVIQDIRVQEYLPFQTAVVEGDTHFHLRNKSVYPVETKYHTIEQGDTLCAHSIGHLLPELRDVAPTCPGCIAKAKNLIASHLLSRETNPRE